MEIGDEEIFKNLLNIQGRLLKLENQNQDVLLDFEKRLVRAEELLKFSDHDERIHDLENIGAESRLLNLEKEVNGRKSDMVLCNRVDRLEDRYQSLTKDQHPKLLQERLDKLEKQMSKLTLASINEINRKPHKCPVCNGHGKIALSAPLSENQCSTTVSCAMTCKSCEGKGLVWG